IYYFAMIGILLAGVAALLIYIVWTVVPPERAIQGAELGGGWLNNLDSSSFIFWTLAVVAAGLLLLVGTLLWAFRRSSVRVRWSDVAVVVLIAIITCTGLVIIEELSHVTTSSAEDTAAPLIPGQEEAAAETGARTLPLVVAW